MTIFCVHEVQKNLCQGSVSDLHNAFERATYVRNRSVDNIMLSIVSSKRLTDANCGNIIPPQCRSTVSILALASAASLLHHYMGR